MLLAAASITTMALASSGDDFPKGNETPEGVACDFARAFIWRDAALFDTVVLPAFGGGEPRAQYEAFLGETRNAIVEESRRPADRGPQAIIKVFAPRALSRSGPASFGYAAFNFADVKFVDVVVALYGGGTNTNRTLVVKDSNGRWHVHPAPDIHPMLSIGLNQESPSAVEVLRDKDRSL
jgi:hypothetical protein